MPGIHAPWIAWLERKLEGIRNVAGSRIAASHDGAHTPSSPPPSGPVTPMNEHLIGAKEWLRRISALPLAGKIRVMNVCGGHERSISQAGLRGAFFARD